MIPCLPRRACLALARGLGRAHWRLDRRGRAVTLANLEAAFGARFTPAERVRIGRESFENFSRALLDLFWARRLHAGNFARWMILRGVEGARETRAGHRGASLLIQTHFGSYEALSLATGFAGLPTTIVMQNFKNESLDALFIRARQHSGHRLIGQSQSMLRLMKAMRHGGGTGLLIDLNLRPEQSSVAVEAFGGLKMCVTVLHAVLHERTGVPLIPTTSLPRADGTCEMIFHPPLAFPPGTPRAAIAQACWDFFEPMIRERPELWLWSYKHFRFRPTDAPEPGRYPFYARASEEFDRLAAGSATAATPAAG